MVDKIKLESIMHKRYDKQTGKPVLEEVTEFVCSNCRHLVEQDDSYCWSCGSKLTSISKVEHYVLNKLLTDDEFGQAKLKSSQDLQKFIKGIPDRLDK